MSFCYRLYHPPLSPIFYPLSFSHQHQQQHRSNHHWMPPESMRLEELHDEDLKASRIIVREVWAFNIHHEFRLIAEVIKKFPLISIDTEFPGVVFKPCDNNHRNLSPAHKYQLMKLNVDALNLIQVGFTFSDKDGNLPDLGTNGKNRYIWQFNFRDFNVMRDIHSRDSIMLLHRQGINFRRNAIVGVSSALFAMLAVSSGLLFNDAVTWVTFHGAYDFGYLVKILTRRPLPMRLDDFMRVLKYLFGSNVYDIKHVMRFCNGLFGGLERVAQTLQLERVNGKTHQAGSDSLLTMQTFHKMNEIYFGQDQQKKHANVLFGLECS